MELHFLSAAMPLTKTITATSKDPYPLVKNFTSHKELIVTPVDFYRAVQAHAKLGHCLIKGTLTRPLVNEPRAGTTRTDDKTAWICLDFDRFETGDIDEQLTSMGLADVTYILQYSSSHGLSGNEGTISAHVFMLLDTEVHAPALKAWLMGHNLTLFRDELRLSRCKNLLSWPLDITTCQNDKLLYIAPPKFRGLDDPVENRLQLVTRPLQRIPIARIGERHIDALKNDAKKALNELRTAEGLKPRTAGTSWVGPTEVLNKPNVASVTGVKDCGDYVRLNLNGGDSWAYWHHADNFELIHDFKGDCAYKTKELLPGYYSDLCARRADHAATPTDEGDLIFCFCDRRTAQYYKAQWNPANRHLDLFPAKNETQLEHWMRSHGRHLGEFVPQWDVQYKPREDWIVDEDNHRINLFQRSEFMKLELKAGAKRDDSKWPTILGIICHMLGEEERTELVDHFLNWFAHIFQRNKPLTAWVAHGIEGTGKGYFANKIAKPLLGASNFTSVTVEKIEDQFNAWQQGKLFIFIDEVEVDDFREKGRVTAKLRNLITEPTISIRDMRRIAVDMENYASVLFSSNRPQPVYIPPSDRRYNVGNFQTSKLPRPDDAAVAAELHHFAEWLIAHKVDVERANGILHTQERERIKNLGITSIVETCNTMIAGDIGALWLSLPDERLLNESGVVNQHTINAQAYALLVKQLVQEALEDRHGRITRDEMLTILQYNVGSIPASPNKFTRLLAHNGIETRRIRKHGQLTYGLEVEWKIPDWLREELDLKKNAAKRKSHLRVAKA